MAGYQELGPIAASLGIRHEGEPALRFERGGFGVLASLQLNSGAVEGLHVHVARSGLPPVTLRLETEHDKHGKERGLNVEVQTGDPAFDDQVYVESDAPDGVVKGLLAAQATRTAVLELLGWRSTVELSPEGVSVTARDPALFDPERFEEALAALLVLAAVPAIPWNPLEGDDPSRALPVLLAGMALPFTIGAMVGALVAFTPDDSWIVLPGAAAGLAVALATRPLLVRLVRGHSRSHSQFRALAWLSAAGLTVLGVAFSVGLNGLLDGSPRERRLGRVTSVSRFEDDGERKAKCGIRWDDGQVDEQVFRDEQGEIQVGDPALRDTRRGRFGARWVQREVTVHSGGGRLPE